jgi:hypothetical protein
MGKHDQLHAGAGGVGGQGAESVDGRGGTGGVGGVGGVPGGTGGVGGVGGVPGGRGGAGGVGGRANDAFEHFKRRKALPLLGYLILALGTAFTFQQEHHNADNARRALAHTTFDILYRGCQNENHLRAGIQSILVAADPVLAQKEAPVLAPRNCQAALRVIHP